MYTADQGENHHNNIQCVHKYYTGESVKGKKPSKEIYTTFEKEECERRVIVKRGDKLNISTSTKVTEEVTISTTQVRFT